LSATATGTEAPPPYLSPWVPTLFGLDDLLAVLDMTADVPPIPVRCLPSGHGGVLGAQLLAQQVVLAERLAPGRRTQTLHTLFPNGGRHDRPLQVDVEWLQRGRSFANLTLTFRQDGRALCRGDVLLGVDEPDYVRHERPPPARFGGPADATAVRHPLTPWEARVAPGAHPEDLDLWLRVPDCPADPTLWRALLAHAVETPTMRHVVESHHLAPAPGGALPSAVIAQTVTFLEDLDVRDWHLVRIESPYAGRGRALGRGRVYGPDGRLGAVFECVGMLRAPRTRSQS
jgi:acyl-CoA thioesterase-2